MALAPFFSGETEFFCPSGALEGSYRIPPAPLLCQSRKPHEPCWIDDE